MIFYKWDVKILKLAADTNTEIFDTDLWIALLHMENSLWKSIFINFHGELVLSTDTSNIKYLDYEAPWWLLPPICYHNINHQSLSVSTADFLGPLTKSIS